MRVGIDVGGTNTDGVLMDGRTLIASAKRQTTADVTSGVVAALEAVVAHAPSPASVDAVMVGTTHFMNALLERRRLSPTAVLRLALPATRLLPPLVDWPEDLRQAIGGAVYMAHGGHEVDGREIAPLDDDEVRSVAKDLVSRGFEAVAVSGVFSAVDFSHEERAAAILRQEAPHLRVSVSHEIGRIGLLERENATALNACLSGLAGQIITAIREALVVLGLDTRLYLSQNDGTLMEASYAERYPVLTIASGPSNSIRGAAFLSGVSDGIVVDVGGTSTDVGALAHGSPREASVAIDIAGVRTNFRMPDVVSTALGGGSVVTSPPLTIGPESVGYRLTEEAMVFGGTTMTATDLAVVAGLADIGTRSLARGIDPALARQGVAEIASRVSELVDRVKLSRDAVPVVLVGGGSVLVGEQIEGASQVLRPANGEVANAIGAAISQVSGQVEHVYDLGAVSRDDAVRSAREAAMAMAVEAGAEPDGVEIVELDEVPLAYLPSNTLRIRAKATGALRGLRGL